MYEKVYRECTLTIEEGTKHQFVTKYAFPLHMVKHTAYMLHRETALFLCCVVQDEAFGESGIFGMFLAEYALETDGHTEKKPAPVHAWTGHHAVVTVPACVQQRMETFLVDAVDTFTAYTEQAEGEYQLHC